MTLLVCLATDFAHHYYCGYVKQTGDEDDANDGSFFGSPQQHEAEPEQGQSSPSPAPEPEPEPEPEVSSAAPAPAPGLSLRERIAARCLSPQNHV